MKRVFLFIFIILSLLTITSCQNRMDKISEVFVSDEKLAKIRVEKVYNAIKTKDKTALKSLFSKKALKDAKEFDAQIDALFAFVQGEFKSWENDTPMVGDDIEDGKNKKRFVTWFTIKTDKQSYLFFLADYPIDEIHPEHEGLYSLGFLKSENEKDLEGPWQKYEVAGIHFLDK